MEVSVSWPEPNEFGRGQCVVLAVTSVPAMGLEHETQLGAGVSVVVDIGAPYSWRSVAIGSWSDEAQPLIKALIGPAAAEQLARLMAVHQEQPDLGVDERLTVDLSATAPWLRLATAEGLNRWLQLPLDQSLIDAERAVARGRAGMTLAPGTVLRSMMMSEALQLARQTAGGLSTYLGGLDRLHEAIPEGLQAALNDLVSGYSSLLKEVRGPDRDLSSVINRWQEISVRSRRLRSLERPREHFDPPADDGPQLRQSRIGDPLGSVIDPRQVRARVLRLSADPLMAEVTLVDAMIGAREAVLVRVPAFARNPDAEVVDHLLVRLIDRSSGIARSHALLTLEQTFTAGSSVSGADSVFQGKVPLRGARREELRADIYDVTSTLPPASVDTDQALQRVRRATLFLREVRRLVADAQLPSVAVRPGARLRRIAQLLEPINGGPHADEPLFAGGPSAAELYQWAEVEDEQLLELLRSETAFDHFREYADGTRAPSVFSLTQGTASLLVAELAAAFVPA